MFSRSKAWSEIPSTIYTLSAMTGEKAYCTTDTLAHAREMKERGKWALRRRGIWPMWEIDFYRFKVHSFDIFAE